MRTESAILLVALVAASIAQADEKTVENPVAAQFREHLAAADQDKDGFVTQKELTAEIGKDHKRDQKVVEQIVAAMMHDLDSNHDGKLSMAEIGEGARMAGQNADAKADVRAAQALLKAIAEYQEKHSGAMPQELEELVKSKLVPDSALRCLLADGQAKPWGYVPGDQGADQQRDVILYSPGRVSFDGQYIVGLADGRVLGMSADDLALDLEKMPNLKMAIIPDADRNAKHAGADKSATKPTEGASEKKQPSAKPPKDAPGKATGGG